MKRRGYRFAVRWIAYNDDAMEMALDQVRYQVSVTLVADLFDISPERVARDVIVRRVKENAT